jgi:hypothetical protein
MSKNPTASRLLRPIVSCFSQLTRPAGITFFVCVNLFNMVIPRSKEMPKATRTGPWAAAPTMERAHRAKMRAALQLAPTDFKLPFFT